MTPQEPTRLTKLLTNAILTPLFLIGSAAMLSLVALTFSALVAVTAIVATVEPIIVFLGGSANPKKLWNRTYHLFTEGFKAGVKDLLSEIPEAIHLKRKDKENSDDQIGERMKKFLIIGGAPMTFAGIAAIFVSFVTPPLVVVIPATIGGFFITVPPMAFGLLHITRQAWQDLGIFPLKISLFKKKTPSENKSSPKRDSDVSERPDVDVASKAYTGQRPSNSGDSSDYDSSSDNDFHSSTPKY